MLSLSASSTQLKHLASATRLISNYRRISETDYESLSLQRRDFKEVKQINYESLSLECRDLKDKEVKQMLSQMILTGFIKNKFAAKTLVKFSTGLPFIHLDYSLKIFNLIENPHASLYNIMMMAWVRRNYPHRAIIFYKLMLNRNVSPNVYTYPFLVEACAIRSSKFEGEQMHNHVLKLGFGSDVNVRSTLVDMYVDFDMVIHARKVFDEGPMMDSFIWHPLLGGHIRNLDWWEAEYIYDLMPEKDTEALISMIDFLLQWEFTEKADQFLNKITENVTVIWGAVIFRLQELSTEKYEDALWLFMRMHGSGMTIDEHVVEAVLECCTNFARLRKIMMGKMVHGLVIKNGIESDDLLQNHLIRMYLQEYEIHSAQKLFNAACWVHQKTWTSMFRICRLDKNTEALFESMPIRDLLSWTTRIQYYAVRGKFSESLALFHEMLRSGIKLDTWALSDGIIALPNRFAALDLGKCIHAFLIKKGYISKDLRYQLERMYKICGCKKTDKPVL
ncbi:hypothetical protein FNV43_RR05009 [Rhamnella rubrinervis]|uniref:Pentatricopeptide repeat-containing protein n=1 Tax=Rhamnella rubrinervis TaxID=2594499 RepID=A0A8K0HKL1_9ROSA|nr:hypothetical protein FNV43_RR05009 [Rhamnella rubrinervis]